MFQVNFRKTLTKRQIEANTLVCVGLDPLPEKLPECIMKRSTSQRVAITNWLKDIIDACSPYTCMFKPQSAHYEAIPLGKFVLEDIDDYIRNRHPELPPFLDCKRTDIFRTGERYRDAHFIMDGASGINFSPYMGSDVMKALIDSNSTDNWGRAIVSLCYTTNPSASEIQEAKMENGLMVYEFIATKVLEWAEKFGVTENTGLVMAAAYERPKGSGEIFHEHLDRVRAIINDKLWFLMPGIGTQGGAIKQTAKYGYAGAGTVAINSSSGITFASDGEDYAEAAANEARKLRDEIREYVTVQ